MYRLYHNYSQMALTFVLSAAQEYADYIPRYFGIAEIDRTEEEKMILRQILVDASNVVQYHIFAAWIFLGHAFVFLRNIHPRARIIISGAADQPEYTNFPLQRSATGA